MTAISALPSRFRLALALVATSAAAFIGGAASAQAQHAAELWPNGPVTFIVPFSAGGGGDTLARLYGLELARVLNTSVIVDNKPGAGGNLGTATAAKAKPDGNTFVFGTNGTMGTNHALYKNTGFSLDDFEPVSLMGKTSLGLAVSPDAPFKTVAELVAYGKKNPDKLSCASGGNGTASHLACVMLQKQAGIQVEHIPYKASATAVIDVKTQRVSFFIDVLPPLTPHVKQGNLRLLAVTMPKRVPAFPDTPTMVEAGVPGFELYAWDGIFVPKGTPVARMKKLHTAVQAVLRQPEFSKTMADRGTTLEPMSRADFAKLVRSEAVRMGGLVKSLGVTID